MKTRVPAKHIRNERDDKGNKTNQVKSAWHKSGRHNSLKEFARSHPEFSNWLSNKKSNTSSPPKKIGRTSGMKGKKK